METALSHEVSTAGSTVFEQPVAGEGTILNFFQDFLHFLLGLFRDDARAYHVVTVFSRIGDGLAHLRETTFIAEVNDEFHLMEAFKVCHFGRITCFNENFKARLHQLANAATENSLLTEEVFFRFIAEGRLQNTGTRSAKTFGISQRDIKALAGSVLMNSKHSRNAGTFRIRTANEMTGAFRSHHEHVHISGRNNLLIMNVKAMSESKSTAIFQIRSNLILVDIRLLLIRNQDHGNVCFFNCISYILDSQTMFFGNPQTVEVPIWGGMEVEVNDGYKFGEGLLTVRGEVTADADLVTQGGFVIVTAKKAST